MTQQRRVPVLTKSYRDLSVSTPMVYASELEPGGVVGVHLGNVAKGDEPHESALGFFVVVSVEKPDATRSGVLGPWKVTLKDDVGGVFSLQAFPYKRFYVLNEGKVQDKPAASVDAVPVEKVSLPGAAEWKKAHRSKKKLWKTAA